MKIKLFIHTDLGDRGHPQMSGTRLSKDQVAYITND